MKTKEEKPIDKEMLDIYSDYLISSFTYTTATGLSTMLDQAISHDKVTRFLARRTYTSKDLWKVVKPTLRQIETEEGVIIFDDSVEEKQYTDENDIIAWHFDHCVNRSVKGINILNCTYHNDEGNIPLAFELVVKDLSFTDKKTGRLKRKASKTKNKMMREIFDQQMENHVKFKYVLADSWFASIDNMKHIQNKKKHFIFALKENRLFAKSKSDAIQGNFERINEVKLSEGEVLTGYLKDLKVKVLIAKQVFKNKDGSEGTLFIVSNDIKLSYEKVTNIYQGRWSIEEFHKSIKSNTGFSKSPTKTVTTQSNHFFGSIYAFFKLEKLKMSINLNHFALKSRLYIKAIQSSFNELNQLRLEAGA